VDSLLEQVLRKDPLLAEIQERVRGRKELEAFLEGEQEKRKAKLGESLGVGDASLFAKPGMVLGDFASDAAMKFFSGPETRETRKEQRAGLVVNKRNIAKLAELFQNKLDELAYRRPQHPNQNMAEALYAAKYPALYKQGIQGQGHSRTFITPSNEGAFNAGTGTVALPINGNPSTLPGLLAHEMQHSNDFMRLGNINRPGTKERVSIGDFIESPESFEKRFPGTFNPNKDTAALEKFYQYAEGADQIVERAYRKAHPRRKAALTRLDTTPTYTTPESSFIKYLQAPIEKRAMRAQRTGEITLSRLLDELAEFSAPK